MQRFYNLSFAFKNNEGMKKHFVIGLVRKKLIAIFHLVLLWSSTKGSMPLRLTFVIRWQIKYSDDGRIDAEYRLLALVATCRCIDSVLAILTVAHYVGGY